MPGDTSVARVGREGHNQWHLQPSSPRSLSLRSNFPGSQPVSMDVQNIQLLHDKPYRVSWKADGTRYDPLLT